ncbi:hypothetical protein DID88_008190 [Monilinia fructigena]|uniref:NDT80 domain-containing protein n=1 Tax=Monilinia fructigena TaxID=38457 RepID=A0A395J4K0_9HELO|nr:hypothetical protein DID88_008190 [Monilinia fructigena]
MAAIKPEESHHSIWQGYTLQPPHSSQQTNFESNFPSGPLASPYHARQKGGYRSMDIPSINTRPPLRSGNGVLTSSPPPLNSHHSYPSLKRSFHSTDDSPYGEVVQDFREDLSEHTKPNISQDHRLLSFSKRPPKHTILDQHGRIQQLDLSAQIHGMFFLSEMTTPTGEGVVVQPELTCYRRNLFQISGSVTTPRGALSVITERGERIPILSLEVTISATESVDGHSVKLIVIPWKTPPPNSPEVTPGQEQEPSPIPLLPFDDGSPDTNNEFAVYPIAYRRLQFRIATANNGRRRELQQHFTLHLNVWEPWETIRKLMFARKEIALVGSSASRGQAPEMQITSSSTPGSTTMKPKFSKPQTLELPRSPFNFDASNLPVSPHLMRQQTLPSWFAPPHASEHTPAPSTPNYQGPPPSLSMDNYLQGNHASSENPQTHSPASTMPGPAPPVRSYTYQNTTSPSGAPVRFIDSNPRPSKSPRHQAPPELNSSFSSDFTARFTAPASYSSTTGAAQPREYFPTSMSMQPWTTAQDTASTYGTALPACGAAQIYTIDLLHPLPNHLLQLTSDASARFHEQLASLYGAIPYQSYAIESVLKPEPNNDAPHLSPPKDRQDQEEEFDFRLFSNGKESKIVLKEDVADEGVFIVKERNKSYFFTGPTEGERKEEYAFAAISGEDVSQAESKDTGDGKSHGELDSNGEKKRKPGKKMRIILREREEKSQAQEEAIAKEKESKEEAERERRARKNREKKVRRKAKEKALKAAAGGLGQMGPELTEGLIEEHRTDPLSATTGSTYTMEEVRNPSICDS